MPSVFLSYRRSDAAGHAGRLYDGLIARFGPDSVFMDLDSIGPGTDWVDRIDQAVRASHVMLAVIGRRWLSEVDEAGAPRLEDPRDFVRGEIAAALEHGLPVVPVLVAGATMPAPESLPSDLRTLARRNAVELSDARWRSDLDRLVRAITDITAPAQLVPSGARAPSTTPAAKQAVVRFTHLASWGTAFRVAAPLGGAAAVAAILAAGVFTGSSHHDPRGATTTTTLFFSAPPSGAAKPGAPNPALAVGSWPVHTSAWTVVLASTSNREAASRVASRAATIARTGVLRSNDYSSLRPGSWVAFSGQYPTRPLAARAAARWHREGYSTASPRFVNGAG